jgi:hypothetical protein
MKSNTVITDVARLISETPCRKGIHNHIVLTAGGDFVISGTQRLRELAKRFRCVDGNGIYAYYYNHNRYFPSLKFKVFCKWYARKNY